MIYENQPSKNIMMVVKSNGKMDFLPHLRKAFYRKTNKTNIIYMRVKAQTIFWIVDAVSFTFSAVNKEELDSGNSTIAKVKNFTSKETQPKTTGKNNWEVQGIEQSLSILGKVICQDPGALSEEEIANGN